MEPGCDSKHYYSLDYYITTGVVFKKHNLPISGPFSLAEYYEDSDSDYDDSNEEVEEDTDESDDSDIDPNESDDSESDPDEMWSSESEQECSDSEDEVEPQGEQLKTYWWR